jgi:hypothetical protein
MDLQAHHHGRPAPSPLTVRKGPGVPIDVKDPESEGWWLQQLAVKLQRRNRDRLNDLQRRFEGDPPLPEGAENAKGAYQAFQKKARSNFAELAVEAARERLTPIGIRTGVKADEVGDGQAWKTWRSAGMDVKVADVLESMLALGDGYMIVGVDERTTGDEVTRTPIITAEDPRQVITAHDPLDQRRVVAALKMFHDPVAALDLAYLYLPGKVRVATRPQRRTSGLQAKFSPGTWDWDEERSSEWPAELDDVMPVVRFRNKRGVGEFERHIDVLDRINHQILQRMVITTMQAFKQRAIKGELPDVYPEGHPQAGQEIDYDGIFVADPGALWMIPAAAEIWESGQADIRPILQSVKDDVLHFAAVTRTPLAMFDPESANQTAEGATAAREGLVFKVEDRQMRANDALLDVLSLTFRLMGDTDRAARDALEVIWAPVERRSLAEKADAASKAASDLPVRARLIEIWQLPPATADRYVKELQDAAEQDPVLAAARSLTDPDAA